LECDVRLARAILARPGAGFVLSRSCKTKREDKHDRSKSSIQVKDGTSFNHQDQRVHTRHFPILFPLFMRVCVRVLVHAAFFGSMHNLVLNSCRADEQRYSASRPHSRCTFLDRRIDDLSSRASNRVLISFLNGTNERVFCVDDRGCHCLAFCLGLIGDTDSYSTGVAVCL